MDEFEKMVRFNSLLLIYQELLSKTQKEILTDYFAFNLSISEIADNRGVSRAAVEDAIKKGQNKLEEFEEKLQILNKKQSLLKLVEELKTETDENKKAVILENIERSIN
ncbi:MAG: DNA-binding protein [Bacilli bacterium]|nr:DNA-binding protein [Bacilli bacterium]